MIETKISKTATSKEMLVSKCMVARYQYWRALDGCPRKAGFPEIRCLQIDLMRWERKNFGLAASYTSALGIVEEVGELEDAQDDEDEWTDAIGDILIYACNLCSKNGLDFDTILEISLEERPWKMRGMLGKLGLLAHVTLKADQGIRGYDDRDVARRDLGIVLYRVISSVVRYALLCGHDAKEIFVEVSAKVMKRDWGADSRLGGDGGES